MKIILSLIGTLLSAFAFGESTYLDLGEAREFDVYQNQKIVELKDINYTLPSCRIINPRALAQVPLEKLKLKVSYTLVSDSVPFWEYSSAFGEKLMVCERLLKSDGSADPKRHLAALKRVIPHGSNCFESTPESIQRLDTSVSEVIKKM